MIMFVLSLLCALQIVFSQTDVSSFGIFTSPSVSWLSTTSVIIKLSLSWNIEEWECIINKTIIESNKYYMCTSRDHNPNATLLNKALLRNTYEMKIELIENNNINNLIGIDKIRVVDEDSNYYDIDTFCLPKQFQYTAAKGSKLQKLQCCYWSQRYSYNNFVMGTQQNTLLKISYAHFRSNVLNYPNQAHEGAIKPPMIKEIGITTLGIENAESSATYSLKLHWDMDEYEWNNLMPIQRNKTYKRRFSKSNTFCEFSSGFSLEITASTNDSFGIDSIIIKDETDYYYNIDMFCNADEIQQWQRYNDSHQKCIDEWSNYNMYYGFIYNGIDPIYFIWNKFVFLNVNKHQQAMIVNHDIFSHYTCKSNDDGAKKAVIFKDNMDDPESTGWIFTGSHTQSLNAVNCPGGSGDKCTRLAGYQLSKTIGSEIMINIDIRQYVNIIIQYDITMSQMPSNKRCYIEYAFDNNTFSNDKYHTSSGTAFQPFLNQSYKMHDNVVSGYTNLSIKFWNTALYDNQYCYIDHVYVFGDYFIAFDKQIHFHGSTIKQYNNINMYNNLVLRADSTTYSVWEDCTSHYCLHNMHSSVCNGWKCATYRSRVNVYYSYDSQPETLLGSCDGKNEEFSIPDADICGATVLKIKFTHSSGQDVVNNIVLWGNVLDTPYPTISPTTDPTTEPTSSTKGPTSIPTKNPTKNPTTVVSTDISKYASLSPDFSYCNKFDMIITTTCSTPNLMYKDLKLLSIVINATKYAIYENIKNTHICNLSKFTTNVYKSFEVYSLQPSDISNGVNFLMQHCSSSLQITNFITLKIKSDVLNEISSYIHSLLTNNNISNLNVSISVQESEKEEITLSDNRSKMVLGTLMALIIIMMIVSIVWCKKHKGRLQEAVRIDVYVNQPLESYTKVKGNIDQDNEKDDARVIEMKRNDKRVKG